MIRRLTIFILIFSTVSCTKDFERININPNAPISVPLDYILAQTELQIAGSAGDPGYATWRSNLIYALPAVQQFSTLSTFYAGDKYLYQADLSEAYFNTQYASSIKNLVNLIELSKEDPANINILSVARILKVLQMSLITDLYGDVPYSEVGRGFLDRNYTPKYDAQQAIYMDMLKELEEAGAALSTSATIPAAADFVYGGEISSWKKFANSLMLRLAMRMQKVDASAAQSWVNKALTAGVISSNEETFAIKHSDGPTSSMNSNSYNLGGPNRKEVSKGSIQWSKTLIDMMKGRVDPRVSIIAQLKNGDHTAANQKGLPNGHNTATLQALTGENGADNYSIPRTIIYDVDDPYILLTHAEVRFLTAEAIERTWFTGNAANEYKAGQEAALLQMASYNDPTANIGTGAVTAYQNQNPYPGGSMADKMKEIHNEMFILTASTLNGYEGWANWRRTGLPALMPTNYPGNATNGTVMRRLRYPGGEAGINPNMQEAVTRMGGDLFTTRVWWDVQ